MTLHFNKYSKCCLFLHSINAWNKDIYYRIIELRYILLYIYQNIYVRRHFS